MTGRPTLSSESGGAARGSADDAVLILSTLLGELGCPFSIWPYAMMVFGRSDGLREVSISDAELGAALKPLSRRSVARESLEKRAQRARLRWNAWQRSLGLRWIVATPGAVREGCREPSRYVVLLDDVISEVRDRVRRGGNSGDRPAAEVAAIAYANQILARSNGKRSPSPTAGSEVV